jgi:hypothetical protein
MRFIVDGFPRQGNTSLAQLLINVFPTVNVEFNHQHDIHHINEELKKKSFIFSPVRNPVETLSSYLEMQKQRHLESDNSEEIHFKIYTAMNNLEHFQEYLIKKRRIIKIIDFKDVVNMSADFSQGIIHKNRVINKISIDFNIPIQSHLKLENLFNEISDYSSTKSSFFEAEILKEQFKEKLTLLMDNHSFLISKSY